MVYYNEHYNETMKTVLSEVDAALGSVDPESVEKFVEAVLEADQVFFVGVGRVLLSLQAMCKRFAHLGIKAHYVGDITEPAITDKDLLIVGSGSGGSLFPLGIAKKAKTFGCKIVHIGSNPCTYKELLRRRDRFCTGYDFSVRAEPSDLRRYCS